MASRKVLKSVAHNFGHSFVSYMNYMETDYVLGLIQSQMQKTKLNKLEVDILKNSSTPKELLTRKIQKAINLKLARFANFVADNGSSLEFVKSAVMIITFDFTKSRVNAYDINIKENPYILEVVIIDDNGKVYIKKQEGWWFPEPQKNVSLKSYEFYQVSRIQNNSWWKRFLDLLPF